MIKGSLKFRVIASVAICALYLTGCGHSRLHKSTVEKTKKMAEKQVLELSSNDHRPDWVYETFTFNKGNYYASGGIRGGADYAVTIRLAKGEALKNLLESIELKARSQFSTYIQGSNMSKQDLSRFMLDGVTLVIENIRVRGIKRSNVYIEKVLIPQQLAPSYNAWVLLEMNELDYIRAQRESAQGLLSKALKERNKEAETEARKLLDKLLEEEKRTEAKSQYNYPAQPQG